MRLDTHTVYIEFLIFIALSIKHLLRQQIVRKLHMQCILISFTIEPVPTMFMRLEQTFASSALAGIRIRVSNCARCFYGIIIALMALLGYSG